MNFVRLLQLKVLVADNKYLSQPKPVTDMIEKTIVKYKLKCTANETAKIHIQAKPSNTFIMKEEQKIHFFFEFSTMNFFEHTNKQVLLHKN